MQFIAPLFFSLLFLYVSPSTAGCQAGMRKGDTAIEVIPHKYVCVGQNEYMSLEVAKKQAAGRTRHFFDDSLLLDLNPAYRDKIVIEGYIPLHFKRIVIENGKLVIWMRFKSKKAPVDSPPNRWVVPLTSEDSSLIDSLVNLLPSGFFATQVQYLTDDPPFFLSAYNTKQFAISKRSLLWGNPFETVVMVPLASLKTALRRLTQKFEYPWESDLPSPEQFQELGEWQN